MDVPEGDYYIKIHHRNHIDVMSRTAHSLWIDTASLYDFTTGTNKYRGEEAMDLGLGLYGMFAGDANGTGLVNSADYLAVKNDVGSAGYYHCDCNMTGLVNSNDYLVIKPNIGKTTQIP